MTGIITQGARDFGHIQYVAAYKVAYSDNGTSWTLYRDAQTNSTKVGVGRARGWPWGSGMPCWGGRGGGAEVTESQKMLSWKVPTRIIESNTWPCTGHPRNHPLCLS